MGPPVITNNRDHPLYYTWIMMRARCYTSSTTGYEYYGGRGIKVCTRWNDFWSFVKDMGPKPSPLHTLDRKDRDGDYEPDNCRWATRLEQGRHRPQYNKLDMTKAEGIRRLHAAGETMRTLARKFGVGSISTIYSVVHGQTWK